MDMNKMIVWVMLLFIAMGMLELFLLWPTERTPIFYFGNILMHSPLLAGWLYLVFKGNLERRTHWFWTPYGLLMITWCLATVYFADVTEKGWGALFYASETLWYALAYGLLFGFYKLESAKPLWYFMIFIAIFWNLQLIALALQAIGVDILLGGAPTLASYFQSGKFWNDWGWFISDMIVDIPMGLVSLYFIVTGIPKAIKMDRKKDGSES